MDTPILHRPTRAADVNPGDVIIDDRHGLVKVDTVNRGIDGYTFLGWPAHRIGSGRRVSIVAEDIPVSVAAGPGDADGIADAVFAMVGRARRHWDAEHTGSDDDPSDAPPFVCVRQGPVVHLEIYGWHLRLDLAAHTQTAVPPADDPTPVDDIDATDDPDV